MAVEPWIDKAEYVADVGVLCPITSGFFINDSYSGISRMLGELKIGFDIVNETMDLSKYHLLILPDDMRLSAALREKISAHLAAGKPVLSSGLSGLAADSDEFALPQWKFDVDGIDTHTAAYYVPAEELPNELGKMPRGIYQPGILMKSKDGNNISVYAYYVKSYWDRGWDGFHSNFYQPPEKPDGHIAAARCGAVCHIAFRVFMAYHEVSYIEHKNLVGRCIKDLLPRRSFSCDGLPSTSRVTLTKTDKFHLIHVKTTYPEYRGRQSIIEEHNVQPAGSRVFVFGEFSSAETIPDRRSVNIRYNKETGMTEIMLPEITGYVCIALNN